jgi:tetratricopeptide (TPR) repeat protein
MRSSAIVVGLILSAIVASAQETEPAAVPVVPQTSPAATSAPVAPSSPSRADALLLYNQGRALEASGKKVEGLAKYRDSVAVCDRELALDPTRMDAYTVKCWSLFRLERFKEVVDVGSAGLKVKFDARIVEVMGESYFHLGNDTNAIRFLQRYLDNVGEYADRVPSAYFYMAESYLRQKRLDHADIAYSIAVYREPNIARWWYRYAMTVEMLGEPARANELYARALKLSPGLPEALEGQSRVKARM